MNDRSVGCKWWCAPVLWGLSVVILFALWALLPTEMVRPLFDNEGASPVELMTLPLFALVIPCVWLFPPCEATSSRRRRIFWCSIWSLLALMAIVRETDLHKLLAAQLFPEVVANFKGTVFKMRFLTSGSVPLVPKLFVATFFAIFGASVLIPLVAYFRPLFKGFFKLQTTSWTMAFFGGTGVLIQIVDRLPANLRHANIQASESLLSLMTILEEGGEMILAALALLAAIQGCIIYNRNQKN